MSKELEKIKEALAKIDSIPPIRIIWYREYARDETNVHKLELISGKTIEESVELFAAGWELRPPKIRKFIDSLSMIGFEEVR